ncbi:pre-rRNA-processing protein ESF2 [Kwoniella heveanensis BCC8398]|uniref:18S rRNA factor 2 n=1 Tax=Kwoniella heveanensis BCC8398 TaxID=1296120 RepID=A0A1B9GWR2_9TREE|nr:pre-rRNA-processing protein ESF2 [Kwoniella heveanensis BCC8398]
MSSEGTLKKAGKRARDSEAGSVDDEQVDLNANEASSSTSALKATKAITKDDNDDGSSEKPSVKRKKAKSKKPTPGIVYISRLPPGMTPQKVRHLMGRWGEVGKVYAQRRDAPSGYNPNASTQKKQKHASANFSEAWVEFMDKSVAKTVASMLNAQVIGGKKGDRWRDDIWTMKYLSGFRWEMLGEQVAYERQAHQARLRNEIARSKTEQGEYLKNVELARVLEKRKAKKAATGQSAEPADTSATNGEGGARKGSGKSYKQRQAVEKSKTLAGKGMDDVLGNVFG